MSTTKVMMRKKKDGWQGYQLVDESGTCISQTCTQCRKELSRDEFYPSTRTKYGLVYSCKKCNISKSTKWLSNNRTRAKGIRKSTREELKARSDQQVEEDRLRVCPDGTKKCGDCGVPKSFDNFHMLRRSVDGLADFCKECTRAKHKAYRDRVDSSGAALYPKMRKENRSTRAKRDYEEVLRERERLYPEGLKKCYSCYELVEVDNFYEVSGNAGGVDQLCIPCKKKYVRESKSKHHKAYWKEKNIPTDCYVCGGKWTAGFNIDHVIPKRLGGVDDSYNRLPLCVVHNNSKWMTPLEIWLRETMPEKMVEILDRVSGYGVDYRVPDGVYDGVKVFTDGDGRLQWERAYYE